jgi:hypothetical protein
MNNVDVSQVRVPDLPPFVCGLIVTAAGGDSKSVRDRLSLAHNAALGIVLEYAGALPGIPAEISVNPTLCQWLDLQEVPADILEFCARLSDGIDQRVRGRHRHFARQDDIESTPFDRAALLALTQLITAFSSMHRASDSLTEVAFAELRKETPRRLQELTLENYLGNVLQDYFDAGQVRTEVAGLPATTENDLRVVHGRAIAHAIFASFFQNGGAAEASVVQVALRQMVGLIWLAHMSLEG